MLCLAVVFVISGCSSESALSAEDPCTPADLGRCADGVTLKVCSEGRWVRVECASTVRSATTLGGGETEGLTAVCASTGPLEPDECRLITDEIDCVPACKAPSHCVAGACVCDTADSVCHNETTVASCDAAGELIFDECASCAPPYDAQDEPYCREGSEPGVAGCACRECTAQVGYCQDRECGDDGCGGDCGDCVSLYGDLWVCGDTGVCTCAPDCTDRECGDDGCGGLCGEPSCGYECTLQGKLRFKGCDGRACGPDAGQDDGSSCGYTCPFSPPGEPKVEGDFAGDCASCTAACEDGTCVEPEDPVKELCGDRECGFVSCGISCGTCGCGESCDKIEGICVSVETDLCGTSTCGVVPCATGPGSLTCGATEGQCALGTYCQSGQCVSQCPDSLLCGTPDLGMGCCSGMEVCVGGKCCVPGFQWECESDLSARCLVDSCGQKDGSTCESCAHFCDDDSGLCVDCGLVCPAGAGETGCGAVDGCVCGEAVCPVGKQCVDNVCECEPQCTGKECGPDGCGGTCGACGAGVPCDADKGVCVCTPSCDGKECGPDGCGATCGECFEGLTCDTQIGKCFCEPSCGAKLCGPDGCGGSCGSCQAQENCWDGQCVQFECGDGLCSAGENCYSCWVDCGSGESCQPGASSSCGCGGLGTKKCISDCTWLPCVEPECCPGEPDSCGNCQVCVAGTCQATLQCAQGDQQPCGKCGIRTCLLDGSCSWGACLHEETQQVLPEDHCCEDADCSPCQQCDTETWACEDKEQVCDTPGQALGLCGTFGCGVETCGPDCTTTICDDPECCQTENCTDEACTDKACLGNQCFYFPINDCTP